MCALKVLPMCAHAAHPSPLPKGEGWGEGEGTVRMSTKPGQSNSARRNNSYLVNSYLVNLHFHANLTYSAFMTPPKLTRVARMMRKHDMWAEKLVWSWLRDRRFSEYKFRRQHPFGLHVLDFFCIEAKLDIEVDGFQHGFPKSREKDAERDAWLEARGVRVMRYWNSHLRREKQAIHDAIWIALQQRAPHPLPYYCRPMHQAARKPDEG